MILPIRHPLGVYLLGKLEHSTSFSLFGPNANSKHPVPRLDDTCSDRLPGNTYTTSQTTTNTGDLRWWIRTPSSACRGSQSPSLHALPRSCAPATTVSPGSLTSQEIFTDHSRSNERRPSPAHRAERQLFRRFARRSSWTSPFSTSTRSRTDRPSGIRGPVGYLHRSHNFVPVPLLDISIVAQPTIILYLTAPLILIASTSITTSIPDPETHLPGRFPRSRRLLLFSDVALDEARHDVLLERASWPDPWHLNKASRGSCHISRVYSDLSRSLEAASTELTGTSILRVIEVRMEGRWLRYGVRYMGTRVLS